MHLAIHSFFLVLCELSVFAYYYVLLRLIYLLGDFSLSGAPGEREEVQAVPDAAAATAAAATAAAAAATATTAGGRRAG